MWSRTSSEWELFLFDEREVNDFEILLICHVLSLIVLKVLMLNSVVGLWLTIKFIDNFIENAIMCCIFGFNVI